MRDCNNQRLAATAILVTACMGLRAADSLPPAAPPSARHYSIQLHSLFTPQTSVMGLFLKARVAGGPTLRLLLDSGAQNIVLDKHAAAALNRQPIPTLDLVGFGSSAGSARRLAPADIEIDGLTLRACDILAVDSRLLEGIDGVIPLAVFDNFLVRLDLHAKTLDLGPYPSDAPIADPAYSPARAEHRLLFLPGVVNGLHSGYLLLDTGATYSALSLPAARRTKDYRVTPTTVPLRGAGGDADGFPLPAGIQFRVGSRTLSADPAIAIDLSEFNRRYPFEITGVVGFPALSRSVVTVDYRDGLIRIQ